MIPELPDTVDKFEKELENVRDVNIGDKIITKEEMIKNPSKRGLYLMQRFFKAGLMRSKYNNTMMQLYFHSLMGAFLKDYSVVKPGGLTDLRVPIIWIQNCLDGNTKIITKEKKGKKYVNSIKKIKDFNDEFKVISHNFNKNCDEIKNAKKTFTGKQKVYKIKLKTGETVIATENHRFFTLGGEEIYVKQIKKGTKIALRSSIYKNDIERRKNISIYENKMGKEGV
jgi:hypothetical protein